MQPTEEAVDDAKEATHGADDRRDHLIAPFNVLITAEQTLWTAILRGWGQLKGQNPGSGRHAVGVLLESVTYLYGSRGNRESGVMWKVKGPEKVPIHNNSPVQRDKKNMCR